MKTIYWETHRTHAWFFVIHVWIEGERDKQLLMVVPDLDKCTIRRKVRLMYGEDYEIKKEGYEQEGIKQAD